MTLDPNQAAQITAHALGELDLSELEAVQALLDTHPEARALFEEMRATDAFLRAGLSGADAAVGEPGLEPAQKEVIAAAAANADGPAPVRSLPTTFWPAMAAAASLMVGLGVLVTSEGDSPNRRTDVAGRPSSGPELQPLVSGAGGDSAATSTEKRDGNIAAFSSKYYYGAGGGAGGAYGSDGFNGGRATGRYDVLYGPQAKTPRPYDVEHQKSGTRQGGSARNGGGDGGDSLVNLPDSRAPSDPPPPPNVQGPQTPAGDATVGVVVGGRGGLAGPVSKSTAYRFGGGGGGGGRRLAGGGKVLADGDLEVDEVMERVRRLRRSSIVHAGSRSGEEFDRRPEIPFRNPTDAPLSTFSIDVDTASYANVRRYLESGSLPPIGAVRVEEMVNYFKYGDPAPTGDHPVATKVEVAACPWNPRNRLVRIGVKAKSIEGGIGPSNLVFLVDVSGSMRDPNKLDLLKRGLLLMVDRMTEDDRVAIVTYASQSGVRLASTPGSDKDTIRAAINGLTAGGSTNGGAGIQQAYDLAQKHFVPGGVNRVLLATDGDFNVGITDRGELTKLIRDKAKGGVFLSVLGMGTGNLKDATLEQLADKGNGHYSYLDSLSECRKVLVTEMTSTLVTVAKDVKIQVEFNPANVRSYRLIGYENRQLAARDFNDDAKDAGEMGADHTVTALYEVVTGDGAQPGVDPLRYGNKPAEAKDGEAPHSDELLTVKVRYKLPEGTTSTKFETPVKDPGTTYADASGDYKFAAAVATFGMLLSDSQYVGQGTSFDTVLELAGEAVGDDPLRQEFLDLVLKAKTLSGR